MPSRIKVDEIAGSSGNTITIPSGQTLDASSGTLTLPASALSTLNASNLTSGTVPNARLSGITRDKLDLISTASDASIVCKGTPSVSDGYIQLNCSENSHSIRLKAPVHASGANYTMVMPPSLGTSQQVLRMNSGASALEFATVSGSVFGTALLHVRDEKAANNNGGTFTAGSFQTRTLNTVMTNEITGASLSSNQITLPAGTYYIHATAPAVVVENHKAKLRNTTDSSDTLIGTSEYANATYATSNVSIITGRFTIASQKTFEIQHRCLSSQNNNGFGVNTNIGVVEVYTDVQIWKVA